MELAVFSISEDEATQKLAEYEALLAGERSAEDAAIARGYRAAARGLPLISLSRTVTAAGWHDSGLPRIAVVRADATECFAWWHGSDLVFADESWRDNRGALVGAHSVRVTVPGDDTPAIRGASRWSAASTIVPLIPPRCRPRPRRLRHCHILWEVESWTRVPPRDPALLRHIRGDLWSVLAVWDLTDLERHVLSQR